MSSPSRSTLDHGEITLNTEFAMPGPILHVGASVSCPHQGTVSAVTTNTRVLVSGQPIVTMSDTFPIAACPFTVGPKPQPCVTVRWLVPATRVTVSGQPILLQTSTGLCQSAEQIPQGPPLITATQTRVVAT